MKTYLIVFEQHPTPADVHFEIRNLAEAQRLFAKYYESLLDELGPAPDTPSDSDFLANSSELRLEVWENSEPVDTVDSRYLGR